MKTNDGLVRQVEIDGRFVKQNGEVYKRRFTASIYRCARTGRYIRFRARGELVDVVDGDIKRI